MSSDDREAKLKSRIVNSTIDGRPYDHQIIRSVWEKAIRKPGFETFSLDKFGSSISLFEYGTRSAYGWILQRVVPVESGGSDDISNLIPLHWKHLSSPEDPAPNL